MQNWQKWYLYSINTVDTENITICIIFKNQGIYNARVTVLETGTISELAIHMFLSLQVQLHTLTIPWLLL